jgi:hypothetical protein
VDAAQVVPVSRMAAVVQVQVASATWNFKFKLKQQIGSGHRLPQSLSHTRIAQVGHLVIASVSLRQSS